MECPTQCGQRHFLSINPGAGNTWGSYITLLAHYATIIGNQSGQEMDYSYNDVVNASIEDAVNQVNSSAVGTLYLNGTNHPLANAVVIVTSSNGTVVSADTTEGNGTFYIPEILAGKYTLSVSGYLVSGSSQVTISGTGMVTGITLTVTNGGVISGVVLTSSNNAPAAGIAITGSGSLGNTYGAISGTDGAYSLMGLPGDTYTVTARAIGFLSASQAGIQVPTSDHISSVDFSLAATASVRGTATYASNNSPLVDATLSLSDTSNDQYFATSGTDGTFSFTGLPAGSYILQYTSTDTLQASLALALTAGQTLDRVSLQAHTGATLSGTLINASTSLPYSNLTVVAIDPSGDDFYTQTGANGSYSFPTLATGTYQINVMGAPAGSAVTVNVTQQDGIVAAPNLTLRPSSQVSGTLKDASGNPVHGMVSLYEAGQLLTTTQCDSSGNYGFLLLQAGLFQLQGSANTATFAPVGITVSSGNNAVQNIVSGTSSLSITVSSPGAAPADALVSLLQYTTNGLIYCSSTTTNANDAAAFSNIVPGNYRVMVSSTDSYGVVRDLSVSGSTAVKVTLAPLYSVSGVIANASGQPINGATILLSNTTRRLSFASQSQTDGTYIVPGIISGTYTLTIVANGCGAFVEPAVSVNQPVKLNETLTSSFTSVIGRVVDNTGNPVALAGVNILDAGGDSLGCALTGSAGTFAIDTAQGANLSLVASAPGGPSATTSLSVATGGITNAGTITVSEIAVAENDTLTILANTTLAADANSKKLALGLGAKPEDLLSFINFDPRYKPLVDQYNELSSSSSDAQIQYQNAGIKPPPPIYNDPAVDQANALLYYEWQGSQAAVDSDFKDLETYLAQEGSSIKLIEATIALEEADENLLLAEVSEVVLEAVPASVAAFYLGYVGAEAEGVVIVVSLISHEAYVLADYLDGADTEPGQFAVDQGIALSDGISSILNNPFVTKLVKKVGPIADLVNTLYGMRQEILALSNEDEELDSQYDMAEDEYYHAASDMAALQNDLEAFYNLLNTPYQVPAQNTGGDPQPPGSSTGPVQSTDPNSIVATGYGPQGYTGGTSPLQFTINFQNDPTASAPAAEVVVTDRLDPNLDWSTFQLGTIYFNNVTIQVPAGAQSYSTEVNVATDANPVVVTVSLNPSTGIVTWTMESIDPITGQLVEDPLAGFLPPDDAKGDGEGYVTYSVNPKSGLANGTVINSEASVVFDANNPINTKDAINTINNVAPSSRVTALPAESLSTFLLSWSGTDDAGDSGIASYTIYDSDNDGKTWQPWLVNTTSTSGIFAGQDGVQYEFYSVATDNVGNVEIKSTPDTTTQTLAGQAFQGSVVVAKNDPVPGVSGAKFLLADLPAVDSLGDVAFKAFITGTSPRVGINATDNSGIWFYTGSNGTLLARTGSNAAGTFDAKFSLLNDPAMHADGSVAYGGRLEGGDVVRNLSNSAGVWLVESGTTHLVARRGDAAADESSANYYQFEQIVTQQAGNVAFLAKLAGAGLKPTNNLGLWGVDLSGTTHAIMLTGEVLVTGTTEHTVKSINVFGIATKEKGQSRSVDTLEGDVAFGLTFTDHSSAIAIATPMAVGFDREIVADTEDATVPGVAKAKFTAFGTPAVNANGTVAFRATVTGTSPAAKIPPADGTGIWMETGTRVALVARTGGAAPGVPNVTNPLFASLEEPVLNNADQIAFLGTLEPVKGNVTPATNQGVWTNSSGTLKVVARTGDVAAGVTGGKYSKFEQIVLPDNGGPIFLAQLSGVKANVSTGLWSVGADGQVHRILRTGDMATVHGESKVITGFSVFTVCPQVSGQSRSFDAQTRSLAVLAAFSDGTWAILQTVAP